MRVLTLYDKVYNCYVYVSFGCKFAEYQKDVKRLIGKKSSEHSPGSNGMAEHFTAKDNKSLFWIWTEEKDFCVLIHELIHTAIRILSDRGINIHASNSEPLCYYLEFLYCEFMHKIKRGSK